MFSHFQILWLDHQIFNESFGASYRSFFSRSRSLQVQWKLCPQSFPHYKLNYAMRYAKFIPGYTLCITHKLQTYSLHKFILIKECFSKFNFSLFFVRPAPFFPFLTRFIDFCALSLCKDFLLGSLFFWNCFQFQCVNSMNFPFRCCSIQAGMPIFLNSCPVFCILVSVISQY